MAEPGTGPAAPLRGRDEATIWVETDAPVRGRGARLPRADVPRRRPPLRARPLSRGSSPASTTPYEVRLDGERVWPQDRTRRSRRASSARRRPERAVPDRLGLLPRVRPARAAVLADARTRTRAGARSTRCGCSPTDMCRQRPRRRGRTRSSCSATRSTPTRSRPTVREYIRSRRDVAVPPGETDRRLRGVHAAVPRVVVGAAHPLAALDRALGDDLRRPRRPRRLEHVARLGRRTCARRAGGTTGSSAGSRPTGSTSTWATSRRSTSPRTTLYTRAARGRGRLADPARVRLPRRPRGRGHALELLPRLRRARG